jgi:DNA-binding NtrC family response regulator
MLKELGFFVVTADSGEKALEIVASGMDISLVILDLTMPGMNGEQCFKELGKVRPNVKVVISSGFSEQEVVPRFTVGGLAGFIQKPYNVPELKEALRQIVEKDGWDS